MESNLIVLDLHSPDECWKSESAKMFKQVEFNSVTVNYCPHWGKIRIFLRCSGIKILNGHFECNNRNATKFIIHYVETTHISVAPRDLPLLYEDQQIHGSHFHVIKWNYYQISDVEIQRQTKRIGKSISRSIGLHITTTTEYFLKMRSWFIDS